MTLIPGEATQRVALCFVAAAAILLTATAYNMTWASAVVALIRPDRPLSEPLAFYYRRGQAVMAIAAFVMGVLVWLRPGFFPRMTDRILGIRRSYFFIGILLTGLIWSLTAQWLLFENLPHVTDAISHDFQARILSRGRLYALRPPCPDAFFQHHIIMTKDGRWFSKYTPGHPLLLALGHWSKMPWLPVALCHSLTSVVLFLLVRQFYTEQTARWVSLLFVLSPLSTLLGASFMSHSSFLLFALLGMYGLSRLHRWTELGTSGIPTIWSTATWTGFAWGWALITRPHDAAIAVMMVASTVFLSAREHWSRFFISGLRCVPGLLPPLLLLLVWNRVQYGTWFAVGYGFTQDNSLHRIYQASFGLHDNFTWQDAVNLALNTGYRFDRVALGWPLTWIFCLPLFFQRPDRRTTACLMAAGIHVMVYFFYDYYGLEFEARYYFNLLPILLVILVRSLQPPTGTCMPWKTTLRGSLLAVMFLHSGLHFWPSYIVPTYSGEYEEVSRKPYQRAMELRQQRENDAKLLILMETGPNRRFVYSGGFLHNDPWLQGPVIFARYIAEEIPCLLKAFPDRIAYVLDAKEFNPRSLTEEWEADLMYPRSEPLPEDARRVIPGSSRYSSAAE